MVGTREKLRSVERDLDDSQPEAAKLTRSSFLSRNDGVAFWNATISCTVSSPLSVPLYYIYFVSISNEHIPCMFEYTNNITVFRQIHFNNMSSFHQYEAAPEGLTKAHRDQIETALRDKKIYWQLADILGRIGDDEPVYSFLRRRSMPQYMPRSGELVFHERYKFGICFSESVIRCNGNPTRADVMVTICFESNKPVNLILDAAFNTLGSIHAEMVKKFDDVDPDVKEYEYSCEVNEVKAFPEGPNTRRFVNGESPGATIEKVKRIIEPRQLLHDWLLQGHIIEVRKKPTPPLGDNRFASLSE